MKALWSDGSTLSSFKDGVLVDVITGKGAVKLPKTVSLREINANNKAGNNVGKLVIKSADFLKNGAVVKSLDGLSLDRNYALDFTSTLGFDTWHRSFGNTLGTDWRMTIDSESSELLFAA